MYIYIHIHVHVIYTIFIHCTHVLIPNICSTGTWANIYKILRVILCIQVTPKTGVHAILRFYNAFLGTTPAYGHIKNTLI